MLKYSLLLFLGFIWGSSFILMKKALIVYPSDQVAALRMFLAFLAILPWVFTRLKGLSKKRWITLIIAGITGNGVPAFLFAKAQTEMDSSMAGMMNSLVPILALVFGLLFFQLKTNKLQAIGIGLGLVGALLLMYDPNALFILNRPTWLVLLASTCYALNVNIIGKYLQGMGSIAITAGAFLWIGPLCGFYLLFTDFASISMNHTFAVWSFLSVAALAVIGTTLAVVLFNRLLKLTGPLVASLVTYIVPIFALMWGVIDGEQPEMYRLVGVLIILSGVYMVNRFRGVSVK